jgi:hypothetical protein
VKIKEKRGKRRSSVWCSLAVHLMFPCGYRTIILAAIKIPKYYNITPSSQHFTKENNVNRCIVITRWESILWELRKTTKGNIKNEKKKI